MSKPTIKKLLPNCDIKVVKADLLFGNIGQYDFKNDVVLIDRELREDFPQHSILVLVHELMHSTITSKRTNRIERLEKVFGELKKGSKAYQVEELIAECAGLIIARKIGLFDAMSREVFGFGIRKYRDNVYVPWSEVIAAVNYYAADNTTFEKDLRLMRRWINSVYKVNIKDSYGD